MYLKTVGKPSKVSTKLCKEAVKYYGRHLLGNNLYHKLSIEILFDKALIDTNEYAYCDWQDDSYRAKEFVIGIDPNLGKRNMLLALAHEMVHVKQYAKGEMKDYARVNKIKFRGQIIEDNTMDYWDLPWEIEAHGRERGLYYRFIESIRK
jgi:hypothetical protein